MVDELARVTAGLGVSGLRDVSSALPWRIAGDDGARDKLGGDAFAAVLVRWAALLLAALLVFKVLEAAARF